ncbi:ferritin-like domain-containing protein [Ciceribacter sp. L1K23]|uniref:ferritin-like domain-containing protein n=1 Tax=Ciceribacter sp. L1K23 TaxID=2820276 RepID=UPI001B83F19F|nr:ferritin-like domain-containing protein [Ciceribacter sp. L1K23]MBR0557047.1 ferritin-like domain-containing protein [Ciceribacter sp. L1K23]
MTDARTNLIDWLRDAHAMEKQAETMLKAQHERLEHYPELKNRIGQHIEETKSQAEALEGCLTRLGESTSGFKDAAGKMSAMAQGMGGMFASDEVVKGSMAGYTFEHMEIASYRALIAAAEAVGDVDTADVCRGILAEEVEMADWLGEHLPAVTRQFLARDEADVTAKR